jgi:pyruvate dehydrogenase E2 component (dihydrolipoamide acetyltransferase)
MSIEEIRLPEISENVDSGDVIRVLVKAGDSVDVDQSLIEVETEKAAFEVPSTLRGKVIEVSVEEGKKVKVGQVIAKVDTEIVADTSGRQISKIKSARKTEIPENTTPQPLKEKFPQEHVMESQGQESITVPAETEAHLEISIPAEGDVPASPSVRELARQLGIDIREVAGTTPGRRISSDDVKKYARNIIAGPTPAFGTKEKKSLPDFSKWGNVERQKITVTRKKIADILSYAWSNIPQVTQYDQADITALEQFRSQYADAVQQAGGKLTLTSILLKVVALALEKFPKFNASFDSDLDEIIYKKYYHVSVAVDTDRGLLVPVIRDADKKNIRRISVELTALAEKTRQHKVTPADMTGGNFTISNLGGIGGTNFAPILYWPQLAILGVARAVRQPVYIREKLEPRWILPLSLSYDHRVIDGAEGLRFLHWIVETLENPFWLALQEKTECPR